MMLSSLTVRLPAPAEAVSGKSPQVPGRAGAPRNRASSDLFYRHRSSFIMPCTPPGGISVSALDAPYRENVAHGFRVFPQSTYEAAAHFRVEIRGLFGSRLSPSTRRWTFRGLPQAKIDAGVIPTIGRPSRLPLAVSPPLRRGAKFCSLQIESVLLIDDLIPHACARYAARGFGVGPEDGLQPIIHLERAGSGTGGNCKN